MGTKIFAHGDSDGVCSASLIRARYPEAEIWITRPVGLLKDMKTCEDERVFICDIAICERDKRELFEEFKRIAAKGQLTYIDHHPLPLDTLAGDVPCTKIVRDTKKSASELVYNFLKKELHSEMNRVALFGAIADYCDETEFIRNELNAYDKRTIYLESGLLSQGLGESKGDYAFKKKVVAELSRMAMPSRIDGLARKALEATKKEWRLYEYVQKSVSRVGELAIVRDVPRGTSPKKAAKFAIGVTSCAVGMGSVVRGDKAEISLRKRDGFYLNLDRVLRTIAPRFGGSGGGHESAAGARIPKDKLEDFIKMLAKEI